MWDEIDRRIKRGVKQMERLVMSTFKDVADILNGIGGDVAVIQAGVVTQNTTIANLTAQLAASGATLSPEAQASLDALATQGASVKTALDAIAAGFQSAANVANTAAAAASTPTAAPAAPSA